MLSDVHSICMLVAYNEDSLLLGILNKELLEVSDKNMSQAVE